MLRCVLSPVSLHYELSVGEGEVCFPRVSGFHVGLGLQIQISHFCSYYLHICLGNITQLFLWKHTARCILCTSQSDVLWAAAVASVAQSHLIPFAL